MTKKQLILINLYYRKYIIATTIKCIAEKKKMLIPREKRLIENFKNLLPKL